LEIGKWKGTDLPAPAPEKTLSPMRIEELIEKIKEESK
jgi:hypothetical protein